MTMNTPLKLAAMLLGCAVLMSGCGQQEPPPERITEPPSQPSPPQAAPAPVPVASSPTPMELASKSGCVACHMTERQLVGPSYQDIAKRYSLTDEAQLIAKVKAGGVGVWGNVPMPPHPQVKDEDVKQLVQWILAGAK